MVSFVSQKMCYLLTYIYVCVCVVYQMAALAGNYVNFGVFELYGDRALADALDIALKMCLSVPLADILAYRKVSRACACTFQLANMCIL